MFGSYGRLALVLLFCACETSDEAANACLFDHPVRLASLPADWAPHGARNWDIRAVDDLLVFGFIGAERSASAAVLLDPCTSEAAPYESIVSGPLDLQVVSTAYGRLLYGTGASGEVFVLDRLDAPGFDMPRQVENLPAIGYVDPVPGGALLCTLEAVDAPGRPRGCWLHDGDPARPPVALGDDISRWLSGADRLFLLHTTGVLRSVDAASGSATGITTDVQRLWLAPDQRHLLWEAGDDTSTAVRRRDLQTDAELTLLQDLEPGVGNWIFNGDGTAAGFVGAGGTFEAVFRLDNGAQLAIPEHTSVSRSSYGPEFEMRLVDPELHVRAYWNPFNPDKPRVWFSDQILESDQLYPKRVGEIVVYSMPQICDPTRTMWRVDLQIGEHVRLAQYVSGPFVALDDGRYLTSIAYDWSEVSDIVVIDPDTGTEQKLAESVSDWYHHPDRGVFYLRATDDGDGVWGAPVPPR